MRLIFWFVKYFVVLTFLGGASFISAENQTPDVSPIFPGQDLPFDISIEILKDKEGNHFVLPNGLQSYNFGTHKGKWLLINGRTNGLHGFDENESNTNFPPQKQNTVLYVVDPVKRIIASRSLENCSSGLTQDEVDSLSVTSAQSYQLENTLYITGGYGFKNSINDFTTFDILTAIDIPGLIRWVTHHQEEDTAIEHIRQISNPVFQITGGDMFKLSGHQPTLLVFGHDFQGAYFSPNSRQVYSEQIRRFHIYDDGCCLGVSILSPIPVEPDPNFRRRDLNTVPILSRCVDGKLTPRLVALSGVFTPSRGAWTVPVTIAGNGKPFMPWPFNPSTFKQGMNNYASPTLGLFSKKTGDMYTVIFGGISYGFFEDCLFQTDSELPFINQVTTIKINKNNTFTQYLMNAEYPVILSRHAHPGNPLLFGAAAQFIPAKGLEKLQYDNGVFKLDKLEKPLLIGYIVGGIQSTLPNTTLNSETAASPYIFKVILTPKRKH